MAEKRNGSVRLLSGKTCRPQTLSHYNGIPSKSIRNRNRSCTIYFSPQVTAAAPRGRKTVLNALLLYIETGRPFAGLVKTLLRWSVNQYLNPGATAYAGKLEIDAGQLEALGDC